MAVQASSIFEMRADGDDWNAGHFNPSRSGAGTDFSRQAAATLSLADGVTNGTSTLTSAAGGFTAAMIGNGVQIGAFVVTDGAATNGSATITSASGLFRSWMANRYIRIGGYWHTISSVTNATTLTLSSNYLGATASGVTIEFEGAPYEITAVASSTSCSLDTSVAAATGLAVRVGGAKRSPRGVLMTATAWNLCYVNASAGIIDTGQSFAYPVLQDSVAFAGYTSVRGDNGRATWRLAAGNTAILWTSQANRGAMRFHNIIFDGAGIAGGVAINYPSQFSASLGWSIDNSRFQNFNNPAGQYITARSARWFRCEFVSSTGQIMASDCVMRRCRFRSLGATNQAILNFGNNASVLISRLVFTDCYAVSGTVYAVDLGNSWNIQMVERCTFHTRSAAPVSRYIRGSNGFSNVGRTLLVERCHFHSITSAIEFDSGNVYGVRLDSCSFFGVTNQLVIQSNSNSASVLNTNDGVITPAVSPITDPANEDVTTNATANGGGMIRGRSLDIPGISAVSYDDVGAIQSQATTGGSPPFSGGRWQ